METTGDLLNSVTDMMVIIKKSYTAYQNKLACSHHNMNGGWLDVTAEKYIDDRTANMILQVAAVPGSSSP
jgi:hypothetical protein